MKPHEHPHQDNSKDEAKDLSQNHQWRSPGELNDTAGFSDMLHREFTVDASVWDDAFSRRDFLKLMGGSFALAGLTACIKQPDEKLGSRVRLRMVLKSVNEIEKELPGHPVARNLKTEMLADSFIVERIRFLFHGFVHFD